MCNTDRKTARQSGRYLSPQVAPSGECSQGRGRYGLVCRGNPVWSIPERLELKFHERRYTSTLYLLPLTFTCIVYTHFKPLNDEVASRHWLIGLQWENMYQSENMCMCFLQYTAAASIGLKPCSHWARRRTFTSTSENKLMLKIVSVHTECVM